MGSADSPSRRRMGSPLVWSGAIACRDVTRVTCLSSVRCVIVPLALHSRSELPLAAAALRIAHGWRARHVPGKPCRRRGGAAPADGSADRPRARHAARRLDRTAGAAARREPLRDGVCVCARVGHLRRPVRLGVGSGNRVLEGERRARAPQRDLLARYHRRRARIRGRQLPARDRRLRRPSQPHRTRRHPRLALDRRRYRQGTRSGADAEPRSHAGILASGRRGLQGQQPRDL